MKKKRLAGENLDNHGAHDTQALGASLGCKALDLVAGTKQDRINAKTRNYQQERYTVLRGDDEGLVRKRQRRIRRNNPLR